MAVPLPPSSSSAFTYDVFLSFRGEDTRFGFTDNLYKALCDSGIHTITDDKEPRRGDEIKPSLVKVIEESRIAIPVLSTYYADSSFCLDELVTIIECFKAKGQLVLPVFYDVDPSHIRHQIGSYGEAIAKHEEGFQYNKEKYRDNMERLQKWKNALHQVANLSGFHYKKGNEFEHTFIQRIVEKVSSNIKISHRDPEVPPISLGVTEVSQSVPPPQTLDIVPYFSPNSQNVPEVYQASISSDDADFRGGFADFTWWFWIQTWMTPVGLQLTYQRVAQVMLWTSQSVFQADLTWRLVGLMSNVVGLSCYALSPSFKCLIGGWNSFKLILYGVFCLVIQTTVCFGKQSPLFNQHHWLKIFVKFVVFMLISVYSTRYDKCLDGKPEILSMVSNAAFSLVSLCLSKLINFGCEKGIFSYFLGCFAAQLYTIHWKLIFVAIFFGFPLFVMHSSSDNQPEADHGGQVNDSRREVGSGGQHVLHIIHVASPISGG